MRQFTVPQFIDVESKIIGPITARQFVIMLIGAVFIGIGYKIFDFALFLLSGFLIFGISTIFAFFKINGRPFHFFVLNFIQTAKKPSLRVWNHKIMDNNFKIEPTIAVAEEIPKKEEFHSSRLTELSLVVDTKGRYRGGESNETEAIRNI
jgi:hypothetical protein